MPSWYKTFLMLPWAPGKMQKSTIISMMEKRSVAGVDQLADIEKLTTEYPYCATFQILKAIGLKEQDDIAFKTQLNIAAIYASDRSKVYDYLIRPQILRSVSHSEEPEMIASDLPDAAAGKMQTKPEEFGIIPLKKESDQLSQSPNPPLSETIHLSEEPMEDQIMREAMMQIGELEVSHNLENIDRTEAEISEESKEAVLFSDWLMQLETRRKPRSKRSETQVLMEKFIQDTPQISPVKKAFFSPSQMGKLSLMEDDSFVTETLAKIYERQGDFKKAAKAYQNLGLKYPEKSIYFAALQKQAEENSKN